MTTIIETLISDPIDHWTALPIQQPRPALRMEMWAAVDTAVASTGLDRCYWTGVFTGYSIAFGLTSRGALDSARLQPGATALNPLDTHQRLSDDYQAWASGVLYGYKQGTSEHPDADECTHCGQRLIDQLDGPARCEHGTFCEDCIRDWHEGLRCDYGAV